MQNTADKLVKVNIIWSQGGSNPQKTVEHLKISKKRLTFFPTRSYTALALKPMLRSAMPLKKIIKWARHRETEVLYTIRADVCCLGPELAPIMIRIHSLQAMYRNNVCKPPALLYYFGTHIKQEDAQLVQIWEVADLLGGVTILTMVMLASGKHTSSESHWSRPGVGLWCHTCLRGAG